MNVEPRQKGGTGAGEAQGAARGHLEGVRTAAHEDSVMGRDEANPRLKGCLGTVERADLRMMGGCNTLAQYFVVIIDVENTLYDL